MFKSLRYNIFVELKNGYQHYDTYLLRENLKEKRKKKKVIINQTI